MGAAVGLLATLVLLCLLAQLLHLCLSNCSARRAWPNLWCWRNVSDTLSNAPSPGVMRPLLLFQTSTTRPLIENGGGVEVVDLEASQSAPCACPSPYQKVRAALCRCCGHRG